MSQENEKSWLEKLKHTYRLVVMNNETFEEIGSYRLSLLNVYLLLSTVVVLVALAVVLLVAFTPVKRYIPGYGDINQHETLQKLNEELASLEKEFGSQRFYSENFRKILIGDVQTSDDIPQTDERYSDSIEAVERASVDEQLRQEIELEEIGTAVRGSLTTNLSSLNKPLEQMYFSPPISGEISAGFISDKKHFGVDVLAPKNTAVKAAMDGYVFLSDWTLETGNTIGIQHSNNTITFYKHNSMLLKKVGSYVKAGEAVAIIGNTGTLSDGPHLHFELWYKGKPVDPTLYINF